MSEDKQSNENTSEEGQSHPQNENLLTGGALGAINSFESDKNRLSIRLIGDNERSIKTGLKLSEDIRLELYGEINPADIKISDEHTITHTYRAGMLGAEIDGVNAATRNGYISRNFTDNAHFSDVFKDHHETASILGTEADYNFQISENGSFNLNSFAGISLEDSSPLAGVRGVYQHTGEKSQTTLGASFFPF